ESFVDIEPDVTEEVDGDGLKTVVQPLRPRSPVESRETLLPLSTSPTPEVLTRWFESVVAVQRSSPASPEYYDQTARAMVEQVSLDTGLILLRNGDAWRVAARSYHDEGTPGREFSYTILNRVVAEKRTFYQSRISFGSQSDSLSGVQSVVASPIFDARDEVVGVLYGSRRKGPGAREIGALEAQPVQGLAPAVGARSDPRDAGPP